MDPISNVITYRHHPDFGARLAHMRQPKTQAAWDAVLKAIYGERLNKAELSLFRQHTGRTTPKAGGYAEAVCITGRQSGKSQTAADIVAFEAIAAALNRPADGLYALLIAQDQRGAIRTLFRYISAPFERVPVMQRAKVSATADTITLDNGVTIAAYPCRPQAIRGLRACVAVVDELAFFRSSENLPIDTEMLRAVRPTLATTGGRLIILSSPYAQTGALWDLHRAHYGREESDTLVWVASAPEMNPLLRTDYLERMQRDDPIAYASEVLGEFRSGIATLFDTEAIDCCVADWREQPARPSGRYRGFFDASGGQRDAAALAIAHAEGERAVCDLVRRWPAPHNPEIAIAEAAALLRTYGCGAVVGDRYAGQFPQQAFSRHGIAYTVSELDRSALYLELVPRVLSQTVTIPNDPTLLRELRGLERRRGAGRDRVDHRPGAHDDAANALAGAVQLVGARPHIMPMARIGGGAPVADSFDVCWTGRPDPSPAKRTVPQAQNISALRW